jgi:hypothetical protein
MGAVSVEHVRRRWSVGRSVGYALVARLAEAGLIDRVPTLPGDPTLLRATHYGLRYGSGSRSRRSTPARSTTGSPAPMSRSGPRRSGASMR